MLEAAQHNNSASDSYAIFANSTMYRHNPQRIQPMPPPQAKAPNPVCSLITFKQDCAFQASCDRKFVKSVASVKLAVASGQACELISWPNLD